MQEIDVSYKKSLLKNSIHIKSIYTIHYFKYKTNFRFKGEKHNFWEFVYIDSGFATVVAENKEFPLSQGECFLHKPNEHHTIYTTDSFANSVIISFECDNKDFFNLCGEKHTLNETQKLLLNQIITEAKLAFNDKLGEIYLAKMSRNPLAPYGSDQIIKNCVELLILSMIRSKETSIKKLNTIKSVNYSNAVENVIQILTNKLDKAEKVNLDELSYKLGYSKSYLKSHFSKETGYSIIQFFIKLKIERAKELLSQQSFSISEISDMLGFGSIHYFSRTFKQATSMSPSEYISSIKEDETL